MAGDPSWWWLQAAHARPDEGLRLEAAAGQHQRFAEVDALAARLLTTALDGRPLATVTPGRGPQAPDAAEVATLTPAEEALCADAFGIQEQHRRGAWYLPQKLSVKAGAVNLPHLIRAHPSHAMSLAADDTARLTLLEGADAVLLWALLVPLFETLLEPVRVRAAGPAGSHEDQRQLWSAIEERYRLLGIDSGALDVFRFGGGWHRLDRKGQQRARLELLNALAAVDPVQVVARHRFQQLQGLMTGFAQKARKGTPLARRVVTRALQPVVSAYFAGDWLAVLDYLQASPHADEEVITALPEPRLYVGMSSRASGMAAEAGVAEDEIQAMLAAFLGGGSSLSPVEERAAALREWWSGFDQAHDVQARGRTALWGLLDEEVMSLSSTGWGLTPQLYLQTLPAGVLEQAERLWATVTLKQHPGSIVSNPRPHRTVAEALGPAAEFWHGVGLTAWFVCEGPSSRATLSGIGSYYDRPLAALRAAGCPVDASFLVELRAAEQRLGPQEAIADSRSIPIDSADGLLTVTFSASRGSRREGFELVRDIVTRHRRAWADQYLESYLRHRWRCELEEVAHQYHRYVAAKGRPPTLIQFSRFATTAANHWTGGDLGALYTAIGEPAPSQQERPTRLLTGDGYDFARRVYQELGGKPVTNNTWPNSPDPEESRRQWQLERLATESLRYLQLQEALGQPPTPKQFGTQRFTWPWPGEEAEGWPLLQRTLAALTPAGSPPAHSPASSPPRGEARAQLPLSKGGNAPLKSEPTTVRITATGAPVDVSAVLLASNGKVRADHDLVFYNHPQQDGVAATDNVITADLDRIPESVRTIAVVLSIDLEARPTAVFDQHATWRADVTQPSGAAFTFEPPPHGARETVTVAVELYRREADWKVRAVGQGYAGGLAGLATDYGIDVET
ncbi:TerD family protein [Kitasatospora herbaricolor]|uniref:TerD family protein n=1 Tax=Kitasatospora herbaricolor TaxID=68217 RepID=UPI0036DF7568